MGSIPTIGTMITLDEIKKLCRYDSHDHPFNKVGGLIDLAMECSLADKKVVECGTYNGISTSVFAFFAKHVTTIDIYPCDAFVLAHFDNISKINADSVRYAYEFEDRSIDLVYLDTVHNFVQVYNEILAWKNKVKVGGYLSGHDYQPLFPGVIEAVNFVFGKPDKVYADSSWIVRL